MPKHPYASVPVIESDHDRIRYLALQNKLKNYEIIHQMLAYCENSDLFKDFVRNNRNEEQRR